jgi:hypothetical protein
MGWVESPPYFTTLTETACDLANMNLRTRSATRVRSMAHRLEAVAATPPTGVIEAQGKDGPTRLVEHRAPLDRPPVAAVDVYVDDFLLMAQTESQRREVMRASLHAIDAVFRPLSPTDPAHRKEPASVKKMLQGDACWATKKRILGWDLDTASGTINLPRIGWSDCTRCSTSSAHHRNASPSKNGTSFLASCVRCRRPCRDHAACSRFYKPLSVRPIAIASVSHPGCGTWPQTFEPSPTRWAPDPLASANSYRHAPPTSGHAMLVSWAWEASGSPPMAPPSLVAPSVSHTCTPGTGLVRQSDWHHLNFRFRTGGHHCAQRRPRQHETSGGAHLVDRNR